MGIDLTGRIRVRRGLRQELPRLAPGELGFSLDTGELFVGNSTEPSIEAALGENTQILTEHSYVPDLVRYVYRGPWLDANGNPPATALNGQTERTLQARLDERVSLLSFGVRRDAGFSENFTPDLSVAQLNTANIQNALYEIYARHVPVARTQMSPQRLLFVPAGIYYLTNTVFLPPNTRLVGEGHGKTIFATAPNFVGNSLFATADSMEQTGTAIMTNGAHQPVDILVENMTLAAVATNEWYAPNTDFFLLDIQRARHVSVRGVEFVSSAPQDDSEPLSEAAALIPPTHRISGINLTRLGTVVAVDNIRVENNIFRRLYAAIRSPQNLEGRVSRVWITGNTFDSLRTGISLGHACRTVFVKDNVFSSIYDRCLYVGDNSAHIQSQTNSFYRARLRSFDIPFAGYIDFSSPGTKFCSSVGDTFEEVVVAESDPASVRPVPLMLTPHPIRFDEDADLNHIVLNPMGDQIDRGSAASSFQGPAAFAAPVTPGNPLEIVNVAGGSFRFYAREFIQVDYVVRFDDDVVRHGTLMLRFDAVANTLTVLSDSYHLSYLDPLAVPPAFELEFDPVSETITDSQGSQTFRICRLRVKNHHAAGFLFFKFLGFGRV